MQQGDCNAPATFKGWWLQSSRVHWEIRTHISWDIFMFSNSIDDHEEHLGLVFDKSRKQLFLEKRNAIFLQTNGLSRHVIDNRGIHADADKMSTSVSAYRGTKHDVQRFLGLVQYLAHFMPDVSSYTGPLQAIQKNRHPFHWRPITKRVWIISKFWPVRPDLMQLTLLKTNHMGYLRCLGIGSRAVYGQGQSWKLATNWFMSKVYFCSNNYRVFEMETIAILEASSSGRTNSSVIK